MAFYGEESSAFIGSLRIKKFGERNPPAQNCSSSGGSARWALWRSEAQLSKARSTNLGRKINLGKPFLESGEAAAEHGLALGPFVHFPFDWGDQTPVGAHGLEILGFSRG